ncbi:MAG: Ni/Fe hydrogenase subunit alpha [Chloroflexi bacterium]|nr:Ni/Fe hydrogenase subunit alpha [Chloroflexota bacterium]
MTKKIVIEPITRIEGHGKVTIELDNDGNVADTRFNVVEFRGVEKFCEGRLFWEMPLITARVCGICPVSHHLAAAKAGDAILGVELPPAAKRLRELLHMAQYVQSHSLHFFHLASPDLLLGMDADPAKRNVIGLIAEKPEIAVKGVMLRKFGQELIEALGGKKVHPNAAIPGGMNKALSHAERDRFLGQADRVIADIGVALDIAKDYFAHHGREAATFAVFPSCYMGLVGQSGNLELYDGTLRVRDSKGFILEDNVDPSDYLSIIEETVEDWSYLKFPYYKKWGYPAGTYRVGPLGRLNVADRIATPLADKEFRAFKKLGNDGIVEGSLYYHYARLIEALYAAERLKALLEDELTCSTEINVNSSTFNEEGIGVIEAPRGTLIHHYWVDRNGTVRKANLIVATGHNNGAINRAVHEVAKEYIKGTKIAEGMLNRVEAAIRCYDPCLSCSTHALGQMPLRIEVVSPSGEVLDCSQTRP